MDFASDMVFDPHALVALQESLGVDSTDFVVELVGQGLEEMEALLRAMRYAVAGGDWREMRRTAHTIRSSALVLGAIRLGRTSRRAEEACTDGMPADAAGWLASVDAEFTCAREALQQEMAARLAA